MGARGASASGNGSRLEPCRTTHARTATAARSAPAALAASRGRAAARNCCCGGSTGVPQPPLLTGGGGGGPSSLPPPCSKFRIFSNETIHLRILRARARDGNSSENGRCMPRSYASTRCGGTPLPDGFLRRLAHGARDRAQQLCVRVLRAHSRPHMRAMRCQAKESRGVTHIDDVLQRLLSDARQRSCHFGQRGKRHRDTSLHLPARARYAQGCWLPRCLAAGISRVAAARPG